MRVLKMAVAGIALTLPSGGAAQVDRVADQQAAEYARARAACSFAYQEQLRLRCSGEDGAPQCRIRYERERDRCLASAERDYVRDLRRLLRRY
jgi:hypothetical protein